MSEPIDEIKRILRSKEAYCLWVVYHVGHALGALRICVEHCDDWYIITNWAEILKSWSEKLGRYCGINTVKAVETVLKMVEEAKKQNRITLRRLCDDFEKELEEKIEAVRCR
jgi:hypothetical protein